MADGSVLSQLIEAFCRKAIPEGLEPEIYADDMGKKMLNKS